MSEQRGAVRQAPAFETDDVPRALLGCGQPRFDHDLDSRVIYVCAHVGAQADFSSACMPHRMPALPHRPLTKRIRP